MSQPFIGQILTFAGTFAPVNYALCNGQLVQISQNSALYNLIGTTYGGDGINTFGLPNLQSRVPVHMGQGVGLSNYVIGQPGGSENVTLSTSQLPSHNHFVNVVTGQGGNSATPASNVYLADEFQNGAVAANVYLPFANANQTALANNSIGQQGSSLPHDNIQPYVAITYCIALYGIYPSQS